MGEKGVGGQLVGPGEKSRGWPTPGPTATSSWMKAKKETTRSSWWRRARPSNRNDPAKLVQGPPPRHAQIDVLQSGALVGGGAGRSGGCNWVLVLYLPAFLPSRKRAPGVGVKR